MILGIVSLVCCGVGLITGAGAIVLSIMSKKEIEASGGLQTGEGMATAGLILGIIGIAFSVVWIPWYFM
jgi:hypothetical protein